MLENSAASHELVILEVWPCQAEPPLHIIEAQPSGAHKPEGAPGLFRIFEAEDLLALLLLTGKPLVGLSVAGKLLSLIFIFSPTDNPIESAGISILPRKVPPFYAPEVFQ